MKAKMEIMLPEWKRRRLIYPPSLLLLLLSLTCTISTVGSDPEYTALVYKGCSTQIISDPDGQYSQALSAVFGTMVSHSTKSNFYKTTAGGGSSAVTGLYQCRGDLSTSACYDCASRLPVLSDKLCGRTTAARVQLRGCYMLYEVAGFAQVSGLQLLYKTCSAAGGGDGDIRRRIEGAFAAVQNGVVLGSGGFYATSFDLVYVLAQCEGDLSGGDCGECVKSAVGRAEGDCGRSASGQIYLNKCFLSYSYYPNGVPKKSPFSSSSSTSSSYEKNTGKTVAIILGGAAAVGFGFICLMFIRSLVKKHDDF